MRGSSLTGRARRGPLALAVQAEGDQHQPDGSQRDRHVGEVERGPQRRVDEIGHGIGAHPVGEVAQRAAGEQADGKPQVGPPRVDGEPDQDERQGDDRHREHEPLAVADPERQPPIGDVREVEAEDEALPLADGQRGGDDRLAHLVDEDHRAADRQRPAPAGDRPAHLRRAQPRISPTTRFCAIRSRMIARIGLRSSAKPPPPSGGTKRRKTFR